MNHVLTWQPIWYRPTGALLLLLASGCALLPQPEVYPPVEPMPAQQSSADPSAVTYELVQARVEIHTFRAGWLSGIAHNHVLESDGMAGQIWVATPIEASTARLQFRPWDLELDNPESRIAAGAGFESTRTAADIEATRTRMLGPKGFHSNEHPWVVIDVAWQSTEVVSLQIQFRDAVYPIDVPVRWSLQEDVLEASADFELSHRALGIRPYSAFAGAIAVADRIRVQLDLSARPASSL